MLLLKRGEIMTIKYKTIVEKSKLIKNNVEKKQTLGISSKWSYYFAKSILSPKKDIKKLEFKEADNPNGTYISRQLSQDVYLSLAENLVKYVETNKKLPNYITWQSYKIRVRDYTYVFAKIVEAYNRNGHYAKEVNVNSKQFTEAKENYDLVYDYFVKVFGAFNNTIDGALSKVMDSGYGYYYDDKKSNHETIDSMKSPNQNNKPNCTDSCQVFYNIMLKLIKLGKYKKVELLHVMCSSGGHVKLQITLNDGSKIIRDPAAIISKNGKGLTANWCTNTPKAVNPSWFMSNLNR